MNANFCYPVPLSFTYFLSHNSVCVSFGSVNATHIAPTHVTKANQYQHHNVSMAAYR